MNTYEAIKTRRSVRVYEDRKIDPQILCRIAEAAMYSPSARNNRPWEFIIVSDTERLKQLSTIRPYWKMLQTAPAAIVVIRNIKAYTSPTSEFSIQDCAAATQTLLLAAHEFGLGGVWLGLYPLEEEQNAVRKYLSIPEDINPFSIVSLGYPAQIPKQPDRIEAEKIHWNQY